jgi:hypothetical protein
MSHNLSSGKGRKFPLKRKKASKKFLRAQQLVLYQAGHLETEKLNKATRKTIDLLER